MDLSKIEDILKFNTDRTKFNSGFTMYKRNRIINDYSKIEGDNAIFYATIIDEYHRQNYTAMISINLKTRVVSNISCDCSGSISKDNKAQICPHIVAIALNGADNLKKVKIQESYNEGITINPQIMVNITQSRNGHMGMNLNIDGVDKIEYRRIFNSFKENKKLHRLSNGNYLDLKDENLVQALKLIDVLGIYNDFENMKIPNNKAMYLDNFIEEENIDFIEGRKYISNVIKKFKGNQKIECIVPENLNAKLRDYQVSGFEFFTTLSNYEFGCILADEMGLGKTVQTIAFLLSQINKKSIVIAPTALIYNWKNEFDKFAPYLKIGVVHGNKVEREKIINNINDYDVILTTYTTFRNDLDKYENIIFDYCIIDEAQNIKNPDSIITKTIKSINAKVRFALTGTPIENNLLELWSIFDFIMPGYLYNKEKFKSIFVNGDKSISELKNLIKPFMLRRTKKEVISELPDKIEQKFFVQLDKDHRKSYNGYIKLIKEKIKEDNQNNMNIFSYLTKIRQLCLAPELMVKNYNGKNSKLDTLLDIINDSGDKKILIFSQFTKVLSIIGQRLEKEKIPYSYLDGKTSAEDRVRLVDEFNNKNDNKIFLISLKAGGTGLNLTSASMVIHFDPWWNPAVENQASDRAHRIGQKNVVNVIKLIAKDTVEERVISLQENKKELIEEIIDGNLDNSNTFKHLSKDDIIDLFI
ncbi:DEAD/DEAH box helicase [[Clostridium] dakarense]|uniref:DEAD/DEAH box helicase n=1 Tax=Faecalimicrobium dakarense TaxID=1301100 RepID=UPI0004B7DC37|nr:DEAD/DEAH box helicase [[Clostridium] dakarense]